MSDTQVQRGAGSLTGIVNWRPALEALCRNAGLQERQLTVWLLTTDGRTDAEIALELRISEKRVGETRECAARKLRAASPQPWKNSGGNAFLIRCVQNKSERDERPEDFPLLGSESPSGAARPFGMAPSDLQQDLRAPMRTMLDTVCRLTGIARPRLVLRTTETPKKVTADQRHQAKLKELREKGQRLAAASR